ncbi:MAG TPA: hypothetical protein RMH99_06530 [Sandaracinaceae bacterium LLY-WYZ-13_1]|nr:hypothetical protein [Sandaracinaceae bacterium LLY-WYZ-13_1]
MEAGGRLWREDGTCDAMVRLRREERGALAWLDAQGFVEREPGPGRARHVDRPGAGEASWRAVGELTFRVQR